MTVIATVITRYCTAHASDSLITELQDDGSRKQIESKKSKIVRVKHWRGAMAYYGLAKHDGHDWSTFDWLKDQARSANQYSSAGEFAQEVTNGLNEEISKMHFENNVDAGIGIHLTVYERINDYWIPELFHIRNWGDISYQSVIPKGVCVSRQTYHTINKEAEELLQGEPEYRLKVQQYLESNEMLIYNNGDPEMFNSAAYAIHGMFKVLMKREVLDKQDKVKTYQAIARRPIEVVKNAQHDFCHEQYRLVGGRLHDLAITPEGDYFSSAGDKYV